MSNVTTTLQGLPVGTLFTQGGTLLERRGQKDEVIDSTVIARMVGNPPAFQAMGGTTITMPVSTPMFWTGALWHCY